LVAASWMAANPLFSPRAKMQTNPSSDQITERHPKGWLFYWPRIGIRKIKSQYAGGILLPPVQYDSPRAALRPVARLHNACGRWKLAATIIFAKGENANNPPIRTDKQEEYSRDFSAF